MATGLHSLPSRSSRCPRMNQLRLYWQQEVAQPMSNNLNRILRLNALQSDSCNPGIKILRQNYFKWVNLISSSILTPRPNSYCSVYTIPADLFQEEELEVTSLSEEPVTAIIQWEIFQKLISKHSRTSDKFHRSIWTINGAKHHFNKN